jgi:2-polyprenyl-3-methyl-5-hydroxy-6-metoxy-1,4-benzoquinol methylase
MAGRCEGLAVAEVGVGGGHVLRMFPEAKLTAIDVSGVYLEAARKALRGLDVHFLKGELHELGLARDSFDRVICSEVLEHTADPEAILAAISEVLRPNGAAVITVPNDPLIRRLKGVVHRSTVGWLIRRQVDWGGDEFHLHEWKPADFRRLLERFFTVTDYRASPSRVMPVRACFRCEIGATGR